MPSSCPVYLLQASEIFEPCQKLTTFHPFWYSSGDVWFSVFQVRELNERCQKLGLDVIYQTVQRHDDGDVQIGGSSSFAEDGGMADGRPATDGSVAENGGGGGGGPQGGSRLPLAGLQETDRFEEVRPLFFVPS